MTFLKNIFSNKFAASAVITIIYSIFLLPLNESIAFDLPLNTSRQFVVAAIMKVVFGVIFFFFVFGLIKFIEGVIKKNKFYVTWLKFAGIYALISTALFLIIYPGYWVYDELLVLQNAQAYSLYSWQHIFTNVYHTLCLYLIPTGVGIVIIQIIGASFVVGYITTKVRSLLKNKWLSWIIFGVFLFVPVLINNLYPLRLTAYTYIELIVLFKVLLILLDKIPIKKPYIEFMWISVVTAILMFWRPEGIIYFALIPILALKFGFFKKSSLKDIRLWFACLLTVTAIGVSYGVTKITSDPKYALSGSLHTLALMLRQDLDKDNLKTSLQDIDKVINSGQLINNSIIDGLNFGGIPFTSDFENHLGDYYRGFFSIVAHNPRAFINARLVAFGNTNSLSNFSATIEPQERWLSNDPQFSELFRQFYEKNIASKPLNKDLKLSTTRLLLTMNSDRTLNSLAPFVWTVIPTLIGLLIIAGMATVKRNFVWLLFVALLLLHGSLVFLTAPATFFMYYLPVYMAGNLIIALYVVLMLDPRKMTIRKSQVRNVMIK